MSFLEKNLVSQFIQGQFEIGFIEMYHVKKIINLCKVTKCIVN